MKVYKPHKRLIPIESEHSVGKKGRLKAYKAKVKETGTRSRAVIHRLCFRDVRRVYTRDLCVVVKAMVELLIYRFFSL